MTDSAQEQLEDSIAIVGMSCRFPGAKNIDEFWRNLKNGVESVSFFDNNELDTTVIDPKELHDSNYVKARAILEDIELFDASFFGFSPKEAELTDPQHRLFLECAWEALEDAGYVPEKHAGPIGMYGGAGANTYLLFHLSPTGHLVGSAQTLRAFIHNKNDHLTTRTAYKLNLRGPGVTIQTACSTSLVAVTIACQSLLSYQVDMALAGGATILTPQKTGYLYHERGIGSPDGHCRAFDMQAKGTVGGNGVGMIVLKRYEDAIADGDTIYALIRGSAINNDGSLKAGYTAPSVDSQSEVIAMAQALAEVPPETISYIEAHGTGTPIGDPIEVEALTQAFRLGTEKRQFCAIGSVKTNIGHLDTAAGIAGLIKTALSLKYKQIPPSLHFEQPNPAINFDDSPFYVNTKLRNWSRNGAPRRAGVSSFGIGGTNAHVILEEAPTPTPSSQPRPQHLILLSGKTAAAMEATCRNLIEYLKENPSADIADVAYTLQVGRQAFDYRRMVVCQDVDDAISTLDALVPERVYTRYQEAVHRPLTFMFPGQGAQYAGMAFELYALEPTFRDIVDHCAEQLQPILGLDLRHIIYPPEDQIDRAAEQLKQTSITQPAIFVIEYAMAKLWISWGVQPQSMIGHSIGEYVAACLAGVFSLEDALTLVATRGRLIQSLPEGAMLAIPRSEKEIQAWLYDDLSLAVVNAPERCVVSGSMTAIDALEQQLVDEGIICRRLHTLHAFHSYMMAPILDTFATEVKKIQLNPPQIPYISNITGTWITPEEAINPLYWRDHISHTVRFADGLGELLKDPQAILLEVGPGRVLRTISRWHPHKKPAQFMLSSLPTPQEKEHEYAFLLNTIGQLWLAGVELNWDQFYANEQRRRLSLPTYPFDRQRYWVNLPQQQGAVNLTQQTLMKYPDIANWFYVPTWQMSVPFSTIAPTDIVEAPYLIFANDSSLCQQLIQQLQQTTAQTTIVTIGQTFQEHTAHHFTLNPNNIEDYKALLSALSDNLPKTILYCWSLPTNNRAMADPHTYLEHSFYPLLSLTQAIGSQQITMPMQWLILSSNMQEVIGNDLLHPEQATIMGLCQVVPKEYPNITVRNIDIDSPPTNSPHAKKLVSQLMHELATKQTELVVAYRGARRWQRDFTSVRLPQVDGVNPALRVGGVYLITGGVGGLGLEVATYLAQTVQAKMVLIGRTPFPPSEQWDTLASHHDEQSEKIHKLQALIDAGADVTVYTADVADEDQMADIFAQTKAKWGQIHGVIHMAGVPGGGFIQRKERQTVEEVLLPKVKGTQVIASLLEAHSPDFFILFSSLTTVVGRLGQVDYTAANAYLDAFAKHYQMKKGILTTSINWGAWSDVGMAAIATNGYLADVLDHPLLEKRILKTENEERYATNFNVDKHWVLDEHRILGNPVIPGVAYFEMVRAALDSRAEGRYLEFIDVFFVAPLRVQDGETKEVQLVLNKQQEDGYRFAIRSAQDENSTQLRDFTVGRVNLPFAEPLNHYDVDAIRQRCNVQEILLAEEEREEDLGPRWHSVQRVYIGENEVLLVLELPEAFTADFEHMKFHPAILDRAAGIAKNFLAKEGHYLPLTYKSLKIKAPLQRKIYSYARFKPDESPDRETISFDIILMSREGVGLVEISDFTQKRVNDPGAEIRALAEAMSQKSHNGNGVHATNSDSTDLTVQIQPQEGIEAFRRILATNISSQVIVNARNLQAEIAHADAIIRQRILQAAEAEAPVEQTYYARPELNNPYTPPRNELEETIASVWQDVLGIEQVGIDDNFFDLHGDSLVAIQLISHLEQLLGIIIPPVAVFEGSTIRQLVEIIAPQEEGAAVAARQGRGEMRRERAGRRRRAK